MGTEECLTKFMFKKPTNLGLAMLECDFDSQSKGCRCIRAIECCDRILDPGYTIHYFCLLTLV